jgi:hypothetical protein
MIRKTAIALAALTALGAAALAPTSASAWGFKHHHHHFGHWGPGFGIGFVDVAPVADCYLVQKMTRSGYVKTIRVCD